MRTLTISAAALLMPAPAIAAGLTSGRVPAEDVDAIASEAQAVALDAERTLPMLEPWSGPQWQAWAPSEASILNPTPVALEVGRTDWAWLVVPAGFAAVCALFCRFADDADRPPAPVTPTTPSNPAEGPDTPVQPAIPEPGTWAMLLGGFLAVGGVMRRRRLRFAR